MGFDLYFVGAPPSTQLCNPAKHDTPCRTAKNEEGVWRCETSGRARAVVAKGVYAYAHTFWDNDDDDDDDDEDGERESKEERRNRMNGKGEGEGGGGQRERGGGRRLASALMRSGDMRTRRGQEENCYASEECSLSRPVQLSSYTHTHTHRTACGQCHAE